MENEAEPSLASRSQVRRMLIDALVRYECTDFELRWAAAETPGLMVLEDFTWLLEKATMDALPMLWRNRFAKLAHALPWYDSVACVEAWLAIREIEPVASQFHDPLCIALDSDEAKRLRKGYADATRRRKPRMPEASLTSVSKRIAKSLVQCETEDSRFFLNVCADLTAKEDRGGFGLARFVSKSSGWSAADPETKTRIIEAAKRLLSTDSDEPERIHSEPLNTLFPGYMSAIWLIMECEPDWFDTLPATWWERWTCYIVKQLCPRMVGEPDEPKSDLLFHLHRRAPNQLGAVVIELATAAGQEAATLSNFLFDLLRPIADPSLDRALFECLMTGTAPHDRIGPIARFVVARNGDYTRRICDAYIGPDAFGKSDDMKVSVAVAILSEQAAGAWNDLVDCLKRRTDLAERVLSTFAYEERIRGHGRGESASLAGMTATQIGELVLILMTTFSPDTDPKRTSLAYNVGPADYARELRNNLINWLGQQRTVEVIEALRTLEREFGDKHPWLRRPRAQAERLYRLGQWDPIPPMTIAEVLAAANKRVIISGQDAIEGVVAALAQYEHRLRYDSPSDIEDLWNLPSRGQPTPKEEERVSDKLCIAIRDYFREYAVTADREVQICRRKLSSAEGGASGSEVDVLCRVPAIGAKSRDAIVVPIEVKLSHNREARTGMQNQLLDRYMKELGTPLGVFVVAWMGVTPLAANRRALWPSVDAAKQELDQKAKGIMAACEELEIRAVVIDASLPNKS